MSAEESRNLRVFWCLALVQRFERVLAQDLEILEQFVHLEIAFCESLGSCFRRQTLICVTLSHGINI